MYVHVYVYVYVYVDVYMFMYIYMHFQGVLFPIVPTSSAVNHYLNLPKPTFL